MHQSLLARRPVLGALFGWGLLALVGLPPFSIFLSEFTMARAEIDQGLWWAVAVSLICLSIIFVSLTTHARAMLFGDGQREMTSVTAGVFVPLAGALCVCVVVGVSSWPLLSLLHAAAHVVAP